MQACLVDSNSIKAPNNTKLSQSMWKLNLLKAERQNNNNKQITKKQNKTKQKPLILIGKPQRPARSRRTSKNVSASHCQPSCLQSGERQCGREGKGILRRGTAKRFPSATVASEGWKKKVLEVRKEMMNLKGQKRDSYGRMSKHKDNRLLCL